MQLNKEIVKRIVALALKEDIGAGDVTCESVLPEDAVAHAFIVSRADGILAGLPVAEEVFRQVSAHMRFNVLVREGERIKADVRLAEITGPSRAVLTAERVALNFLQRLSGIATLTRRCVDAVRGYDVKIMDTRKTSPGLRHLEKYAVRVGGGMNHRAGLFDQVLIKDNHLRMLLSDAGDLPAAVRLAVQRAREELGHSVPIEVEAESLAMVTAGIEAGADIIMLDNMSVEQMSQAVGMVRGYRRNAGAAGPLIEASGGVTERHLVEIAATGVDWISLGALTHSAAVLDLAMDIAS